MKMQRIMSILVFALASVVFIIILNFANLSSDELKVIEICKKACEARVKNYGVDNEGKCLLNPVPNYPDWVCDIAHSPRLPIDSLCENMCSEYKEYKTLCPNATSVGRASHFVEVDPNCNLIRVVK